MLIPSKAKQPGGTSRLAQISELAAQCTEEGQQTLLEFAEFLALKYPREDSTPDLEIVPIERPEQETVIAAIRRLSQTYPMLDRDLLFQQTSQAMSDHVLRAVSDKESIDRLEAVFRKAYEALLEKSEGPAAT